MIMIKLKNEKEIERHTEGERGGKERERHTDRVRQTDKKRTHTR